MDVSGNSSNVSGAVVLGPAQGVVVVSPPAQSTLASTLAKWGGLILVILAGILGNNWGPYVALAIAGITGVGAFFFHKAMVNWEYDTDTAQAGATAGVDATVDQQKTDSNLDQVDDFLNRDQR